MLFVASSVIWSVPPAFVAWSRVALAAMLLLPLAWSRAALAVWPPQMPGTAALLSIVVLSEQLGVMSLLGLLMILGRSWLATMGSPRISDTHA